MIQISLTAELCFLGSPHRVIIYDELILCWPQGQAETHQWFNGYFLAFDLEGTQKDEQYENIRAQDNRASALLTALLA